MQRRALKICVVVLAIVGLWIWYTALLDPISDDPLPPLVFHSDTFKETDDPKGTDNLRHRMRRSALEAIRIGSSYEEVIRSLGPPTRVEPRIDAEALLREARITVGQAQKDWVKTASYAIGTSSDPSQNWTYFIRVVFDKNDRVVFRFEDIEPGLF